MSKDVLNDLAQSIMNGDPAGAKASAEDALKLGMDPIMVIREGLSKGLDTIGEKFDKLEVFLPELMLAADAARAAMEVLKAKMTAEKRATVEVGTVVIGTVKADVHDIGKNIVAVLLSVNGFKVFDLGTDVPPKKFLDKAREVDANIIALSSLMATTRYYQEEVIRYLRDLNLRDRFRVVVGGGAVTLEWAEQIGADGYARDANEAVTICKRLVAKDDKEPKAESILVGK